MKFPLKLFGKRVLLLGGGTGIESWVPQEDKYAYGVDLGFEAGEALVSLIRAVLASGGGIVALATPEIAPLAIQLGSEYSETQDAENRNEVRTTVSLYGWLPLDKIEGVKAETIPQFVSRHHADLPVDQARRAMLQSGNYDAAVLVGNVARLGETIELLRDVPVIIFTIAGGNVAEIPRRENRFFLDREFASGFRSDYRGTEEEEAEEGIPLTPYLLIAQMLIFGDEFEQVRLTRRGQEPDLA